MENLPEPPNVPISKLADMVGRGKTTVGGTSCRE